MRALLAVSVSCAALAGVGLVAADRSSVAVKLLENRGVAVRATVRVGPEPVGVALADGLAFVANSARFTAPYLPQTIAVVDTKAALAGQPALLGSIPAGSFPRNVTVLRDHAVVVTNYDSLGIETFTVASVRRAVRAK